MCSLSAAGDWRSSPFAAAMSSLSFEVACQSSVAGVSSANRANGACCNRSWESRRDRSRKRQGQALAFWSGRDRW